MGYSDAPRIFTKVMKPVLSYLRHRVVMIVMYIDDALIVSSARKQIEADTTATLTLFNRLGFTINTEKSCLQPTQEITYLEFLLNSKTLSICPTQQKLEDNIGHACKLTLRHTEVTIGHWLSWFGNWSLYLLGINTGQFSIKGLKMWKMQRWTVKKGTSTKPLS